MRKRAFNRADSEKTENLYDWDFVALADCNYCFSLSRKFRR